MNLPEPTVKQRHLYLKVDDCKTKEDLDELEKEVEKTEGVFKGQILQKIKMQRIKYALE